MSKKIMKEGLTYDDVLVIPAYSEILPYMVSTSTQFSKKFMFFRFSFSCPNKNTYRRLIESVGCVY